MNVEINGKYEYLWNSENGKHGLDYYLELEIDRDFKKDEILVAFERRRKKVTKVRYEFLVTGTGVEFQREEDEGSFFHRIYIKKLKREITQ